MKIKEVDIYVDGDKDYSFTGKSFRSMLKACTFVHQLFTSGITDVWVCVGNYNLSTVNRGESLQDYYKRMLESFHNIFG